MSTDFQNPRASARGAVKENTAMNDKTNSVTDALPDLDAAERLLLANGYNVVPPVKPLTFEDVTPMTEAPPEGTVYWVVSALRWEGVFCVRFFSAEFDPLLLKRRMAYLEKEHALIAARHIFGLKGGEL